MVNMKKQTAKQEKLVKDWNTKYPVGTEVIVTKDDGTEFRTETIHEASVLGGHTAVGWVKGISGCYALTRIRPVQEK